jgi:hypothetical protein
MVAEDERIFLFERGVAKYGHEKGVAKVAPRL